MKRSVAAIVLSILVLAMAGLAFGAGRGPVLSSRIEALPWYSPDEPLTMRFTLQNNSSETLYILKWQLPSDDIDSNILSVQRNGGAVTYTGPLVKRAAPTEEDYLEIAPGGVYSVDFDPSNVYDMTKQGQYSIRFRLAGLFGKMAGAEGADAERVTRMAMPQGEAATFWFEGLPEDANVPDELTPAAESLFKIGGYTKCTTAQQSTLVTAHNNAISIATKAKNHLAANPSGSTLYTYWFGTYQSSRFNTVVTHYNSIIDAFTNKSVTYDCSCKKSYYAYVYPTQPYKIYVCKAFWSAPALGTDCKAGTLVHEMTHFNVTCGTDDYVYGSSGAHNLAVSNPSQAIDNADNHEYFAENQP